MTSSTDQLPWAPAPRWYRQPALLQIAALVVIALAAIADASYAACGGDADRQHRQPPVGPTHPPGGCGRPQATLRDIMCGGTHRGMRGEQMATGTSWDDLRLFITVVRTGSFSAAADELGVAQSSVSEHIARLERALGHRLVERSPAGVRATDRGVELAARIAAPVDALAAATESHRLGTGAARTVFLAGPAEFLSEIILPGLAARLPTEVQVHARFGLAEDLLDDLRAGAVDVLVSAIPARGPDLSSQPIYDEMFALVAAPRWADRAIDDLDSVPVLAYGPDLPIIRRYWRSVFGRRPAGLFTTMVAPDLRTLLRLALEGAGMSVLPDYLIRAHLASGELVELHAPAVAPLNTLYVATRKPRRLPDPNLTAVREAIVATARAAAA